MRPPQADRAAPNQQEETRSPVGNLRLKQWAAIASVTVAAILIGGKTTAWIATSSISVLSTLIDSLLDLAASVVNLIAVRQAAQPPDQEHRFGHGKAEPLAGLAQAAFVGGSAVFLLIQAIERLLNPVALQRSTFGIGVMVASIVLTFALVLFQRHVIRRTNSLAIAADSLHYRADLLANLSVIAALVLTTQVGWLLADPLIGLAVAAYILYGSWSIFTQSLNLLMDRELPNADREKIRHIATSHPKVISIHDLRTRSSGTQAFIQFHLELDGNLTLHEAHAIADTVMHDLEDAFPEADIIIHEDPFGIDEPRAYIA